MDDELHRGLEDVLVAETRLSRVDGTAGELVIGGFPLEELAPNATFEETAYLLRHDRLPTSDELTEFRTDLAERRSLPETTLDTLRTGANEGASAMDALRMGAASVSLARPDEKAAPERDTRLLLAQFPTIVAAYWRYRIGEEPIEPRSDLSHAANYLHMLTGEEPSEEQVRGLETYLNSVIDHGLNASTFTARVITSTESDVVSAITGAVGALKGPLHGGAPGPVLEMIQEIDERGDPRSYLRERLDAGERLMGFGHRVYEVRDPRADVLSEAAERFFETDGDSAFFERARETEDAALAVLDEHKPDVELETNVEFYTALLLHGIGIPRELFSATFAVARVGGWCAHSLEQRADNRLIRPRSRYVGELGRTWTPIGQR